MNQPANRDEVELIPVKNEPIIADGEQVVKWWEARRGVDIWHKDRKILVTLIDNALTAERTRATLPTPVEDDRLRDIKAGHLTGDAATCDVCHLLDRLSQAEAERDAVVMHSHNKSAELEKRITELTAQVESVRRETWGKAEAVCALYYRSEHAEVANDIAKLLRAASTEKGLLEAAATEGKSRG